LERFTLMAATAVLKVIRAKRPLAVVTSTAAQSPSRWKMHRYDGFAHLATTPHTGPHLMADRAAQAFPCVFLMVEID
jgi:hypothetical protein